MTLRVLDDVIIEDFNSEKFTIAEMAKKLNMKLSPLKSSIARLQKGGYIGKKDKNGKVTTPPIKEKKKKATKKPSLEDMVKALGDGDIENISTLHKEMIIEILHKIIS